MNDWLSVPLPSLAQALRSGDLGFEGYSDSLERRIVGRDGEIRALLPEANRFQRIRREAEVMQGRFPNVADRPALYLVPVGVKDIFHVDGFLTHAGSRLPAEALSAPEADAVGQLRQAGALVLGKTVTTEFAYFAAGPTRNPRSLQHTPGGSSSGSAAAVAAGLAPLALGTQTIGSILRPASFCGVVGFKPTYGRVSTGGVIPLAPSLDHVGWFTQDVSGSALAAAVLCSNWSEAPATNRPILGIPVGPYFRHADDEARRAIEAAAESLRSLGYEVRRVDLFPDFDEIARRHRLILAAEAARVHAEWFRLYGALYHEKTAELIRAGQAIDEADLAAAQAARHELRQSMGDLMQSKSIDIWMAPAAVGAAPRGLESTGDPVMNLPWTHIGFPAIALPFAMSASGLPIGIQLVAAHGADERLLDWAAEIERHLSSDRAPAMRHAAAGSAA